MSDPFDILITNGHLYDGTGNPWFRADLGIRGQRIAAVGTLDGATANTSSSMASLCCTTASGRWPCRGAA